MRQMRIDKALDKQHRKGFVGLRLHQENMKILELSRRIGKHHPNLSASFNSVASDGEKILPDSLFA